MRNSTTSFRSSAVICLVAVLGACAVVSAETTAYFDTSLGNFSVVLYESVAPGTVANFLNYVENDDYDNSFFHRLSEGFVLQGGGFALYPEATAPGAYAYVQNAAGDGFEAIYDIATNDPIANEFSLSNLRGTLAMAKVGGDPDSATSQFFINLADNSANLDGQNGGFTVFAEILGDGMTVVDILASQQRWNASGVHSALGELPLHEYSVDQQIAHDHFLVINDILLAGDCTGDGLVNIDDLQKMLGYFGTTETVDWFSGDFNADRLVNDSDLNLLLSNFSVTAVPEPATLGLLVTGALTLLRRKRK